MALLGIYALLVAIGEGVAVGALFAVERVAPDFSGIVFITLVFGALIAAWPLALRLTGGE